MNEFGIFYFRSKGGLLPFASGKGRSKLGFDGRGIGFSSFELCTDQILEHFHIHTPIRSEGL